MRITYGATKLWLSTYSATVDVGLHTPAYADSLEVALTKAAPNANAKVIALAVRATQCKVDS